MSATFDFPDFYAAKLLPFLSGSELAVLFYTAHLPGAPLERYVQGEPPPDLGSGLRSDVVLQCLQNLASVGVLVRITDGRYRLQTDAQAIERNRIRPASIG